VEAIEVLIRESAPVQVSIRVEGYLPDGCTELAEVTQMRDGQRLIVELATVREAEAMCTQALVPFELDVPIDLSGLEAGAYTIDVNGVQATLTLDAAMLAIGQ
jgi:inhibitor of cysteine peptidase